MEKIRTLVDDLKILMVKPDGCIDAIFSSNDASCKNTISLNVEDNISKIEDYHNKIIDNIYTNDDMNNRHLFYIKDYLRNKRICNDIDLNRMNDDLVIYFNLSTMGNIILVNSDEHNNFVIRHLAKLNT